MKTKILITGSESYVGGSIKAWLESTGRFISDELDMEKPDWVNHDFTPYDVVIHVAAIVHKKDKKIPWQTYYRVNSVLPYRVAKKAKESKVGQYIFFSSMAVYGQGKKLPGGNRTGGNIIDENTPLKPVNYYGRSKLAAEIKLKGLNSRDFTVSVVRPPNIYGYGCPGNYIASFVKLTRLLPVIPAAYTECRQGFIYIGNLCRFIQRLIEDRRPGTFHPQDGEGISALEMFSEIAVIIGKKPRYSHVLGRLICLFYRFPPVVKVFGGVAYSSRLSDTPYNDYSKVDYRRALWETIKGPIRETIKGPLRETVTGLGNDTDNEGI
jgi:UDP-glucose 4-epimerase